MNEKQRIQGWANKQRKAFRDGKLTKKQIQKLTEAGFVFELPDTVAENKRVLIEMARKGLPRPSKRTEIGTALSTYTILKSKCYDAEFSDKLKKLRSDWFVFQSDILKHNKETLLKMAHCGDPMPRQKTKLGSILRRYTLVGSDSYDPIFANEISLANPDWITHFEIAKNRKKKLLEMAKLGFPRPRPNGKDELGNVFRQYTRENTNCFDEIFYQEIMKIRPEWLLSRKDLMTLRKNEIIKILGSGGDVKTLDKSLYTLFKKLTTHGKLIDEKFVEKIRSISPSLLPKKRVKRCGCSVSHSNFLLIQEILKIANDGGDFPLNNPQIMEFWNRNKYKPYFKTIRFLRKDWFVKQSRSYKNKQILLNMAISGLPRPSQKTKIGACLQNYLRGEQYDEEFVIEIKKNNPSWFITTLDVCKERKNSLLLMAQEGIEKPSLKTKIGRLLYSYTHYNCSAYDPEFDAEIRALRPDWFKPKKKADK
ncbi:MAG: helicase associated domain-containing protein [Paludibacteraceae bacterium]|nr:helicase associated domain-containing protein [Paludibacteraceae bacterium]